MQDLYNEYSFSDCRCCHLQTPIYWRGGLISGALGQRSLQKALSAKLMCPSDVIKWNQTLQQWVQAGEGSTAISKVTFTPLYSNWHHGIPMDVSDMMYADYFTMNGALILGQEIGR